MGKRLVDFVAIVVHMQRTGKNQLKVRSATVHHGLPSATDPKSLGVTSPTDHRSVCDTLPLAGVVVIGGCRLV